MHKYKISLAKTLNLHFINIINIIYYPFKVHIFFRKKCKLKVDKCLTQPMH